MKADKLRYSVIEAGIEA